MGKQKVGFNWIAVAQNTNKKIFWAKKGKDCFHFSIFQFVYLYKALEFVLLGKSRLS